MGHSGEYLMHLSDFDFELPPDRIANRPAVPRDAARLLVVDQGRGERTSATFRELARFLCPGDTLVINDTKVINARVHGVLERTDRDVEVFFERPLAPNRWEALVQPARRIRPGDRILVTIAKREDGAPEEAALVVDGPAGHGMRIVELDADGLSIGALLDGAGHVPLPPYIRREDEDRDRTDYQTIYARHAGAVAAPTAGLHFTPEVFASLEAAGIGIERITLHVGVGTFQPVRTDQIELHRLKAERFTISVETAERLNRARSRGGRIIAVGTTTTRTLEHVISRNDSFAGGSGETDLFIYPGYRFRAIDGLVTNFHLPRSTLLMLVSAFAGMDVVREAYRHAVDSGYRFYSFGDATLFLR